MAKIGKLNIEVGAGTKGLRKDLGGAERLVGKFKRDLDNMGDSSPLRHFNSSITKMTGGAGRMIGGMTRALGALGVAGVAAGAGLGVVAASQIDAIGDQADMAKSLGISRNALVVLQRAAKSTGVDSDKLNASFGKLSDTLGSAFRGDSGAVKTFERLGLSIKALEKMSPEQRFMAVGKAIDAIEDPAAKIAMARDAFGKTGGDLIPLFEGGGAAITDAATELRLFGGLLSNFDLKGIEKAGDAFDTFGTIVEGLKTRLAAEVSPLIVKIGEDTTAWIASMGGIEAVADKGLAKLADGVTKTSTAMNSAVAAGRTASDVKETVVGGAGGLLSKIPGGETIGKALTWNPVRDTVGAIYGKHKSDLALAEMEDKASRRMGGPAKTTSGAIQQYVTDARTNIEDDALGIPRRSESVTQAVQAPPVAAVDTGEPKWKSKIPADGPAKWESKVPTDTPAWVSKVAAPDDFVSKRTPMEEAALAIPTAKASGGAADMTATNKLLEQIASNTKSPSLGLA